MPKRKHIETSKEAELSITAKQIKPITNFPNYGVSENGDVISFERITKSKLQSVQKRKEKKLKLLKNRYGYIYVNLYNDSRRCHNVLVHRLVAIAFLDNPNNKREVNHIDGDKSNNKVDNLEWTSSSENKKHAFKIGLMCQKGEKHASNKLNSDQVIEVYNSKLKISDLAKKYNVGITTIHAIKNGQTWGHLTKKLYKPNKNVKA
jgi:hypothetical protein